jgi:WD40 repeat protein
MSSAPAVPRRGLPRATLALAPLALAACSHGGGDVATISAPQGRLWGARFAPTGNVISMAYSDEDKIGTIDLDSGSLRELTPGGSYLTGTAWSPSGDLIYFNAIDGITAITTAVASTRPVNRSLATLGIDVSPDGGRLAYGVNGGNARIYDLASERETTLARRCDAIRFAPSGDRVACVSGGALVIIELATGGETAIVEEGLPLIAGCDWYRDGQALLVTTRNGVEQITLAGDSHLVFGAFAAVAVDLSPDESSIVIGVNGSPDLTLLRL